MALISVVYIIAFRLLPIPNESFWRTPGAMSAKGSPFYDGFKINTKS